MVWPFMGALGSARGISSEAISTDLAMATFGGIAAGFSAALLGLRCGRRLPLARKSTRLYSFPLFASLIPSSSFSSSLFFLLLFFFFFFSFFSFSFFFFFLFFFFFFFF